MGFGGKGQAASQPQQRSNPAQDLAALQGASAFSGAQLQNLETKDDRTERLNEMGRLFPALQGVIDMRKELVGASPREDLKKELYGGLMKFFGGG